MYDLNFKYFVEISVATRATKRKSKRRVCLARIFLGTQLKILLTFRSDVEAFFFERILSLTIRDLLTQVT